MSAEERDEIIEFLLQRQSNSAERHQEAMNRMEQFDKELAALAAITRDVVEVARLHSKRLDRFDDLNP